MADNPLIDKDVVSLNKHHAMNQMGYWSVVPLWLAIFPFPCRFIAWRGWPIQVVVSITGLKVGTKATRLMEILLSKIRVTFYMLCERKFKHCI